MGVKRAKLLSELKRSAKVLLDTSILIYHLEDVPPYSDLTEGVLTVLAEGVVAGKVQDEGITVLVVEDYIR